MAIAIKESFDKNKKWALGLATCAGAISDICTPLAPFSKYVLIASLALVAILLISYFLLKNFRDKILPVLFFAVFSAFISGALFGLKGNNNNGFLANTIPGIESLQNSLGIISKDVSEIKKTTKAIKEDTGVIKEHTEAIKDNTKDIKTATQSIDNKMDTMIEKVGKQGGIIAEPSTAEEFYHNARIYEINGDYGNARRAYVRYFNFKEHKLDPHIRFQSFLKIQEGTAGAKEIYTEMFGESENIVDNYAKILLESKENKKIALEEFAKNNADFGPAYYELARSHSKATLGTQGLSDKKAEKEYIEKFLKAYDEGKVTRYFIDKEELDKWLKYAKEREAEFATMNKEVFENAVSMSKDYRSNQSQWQLNLSLTDKAREIFYRIDGTGEFKSTGFFNDYIDPATGKPMAKTWFMLQEAEAPKEYIEFKYLDLNNKESQIFKINWVNKDANGNPLDPKMESAIKWVKETTKDHWVSFEGITERGVVYFSFFGSPNDQQPVEKAIYGVNKDTPDTVLQGPYIHTSDSYTLKITDDFEKISLQLFFKDGTKSDVKIFRVNKETKYAKCINKANANNDIRISNDGSGFYLSIDAFNGGLTPANKTSCVTKIMYAIDKDEPDTEFMVENADKSSGFYRINLNDIKNKIVLQRFYKDGSNSGVITFGLKDFCRQSGKIDYVLRNKNDWVNLLNNTVNFKSYFRNAEKCIDRVVYGLNKSVPDTDLERDFFTSLKIENISEVSVQVFFQDGSKSDVEIFKKNNQ